jgi:hypothetical protein
MKTKKAGGPREPYQAAATGEKKEKKAMKKAIVLFLMLASRLRLSKMRVPKRSPRMKKYSSLPK